MTDITLIFDDGTVENIYLPSNGEITDGNLVDIVLEYSSQSGDTLAN